MEVKNIKELKENLLENKIEKRVDISSSELKRIYFILKKKGMNINDINKKIDTEFRNCLYKGYSLNYDSFIKLENLAGQKIEILENKILECKNYNTPTLFNENEKLSELFGIILGDGNLFFLF